MLNRIFNSLRESPVKAAVLLILGWGILINFLFFTGEYLWVNALYQMCGFMIIYPVGSIVMFFKYGKSFGHRWYAYVPILCITAGEYLFVKDFSEIVPNIIVETVIVLVFGIGIGSCFFDKSSIVKKTEKEEDYKKILDD